jgi:hypothetical protein
VKKLPDCFALSEISTLSTEPDRPIAAAFTALDQSQKSKSDKREVEEN